MSLIVRFILFLSLASCYDAVGCREVFLATDSINLCEVAGGRTYADTRYGRIECPSWLGEATDLPSHPEDCEDWFSLILDDASACVDQVLSDNYGGNIESDVVWER